MSVVQPFPVRSRRLASASRASANEIDPPAAALAADKPLVLVGDAHLGAVAFRHFGRVGLDLVPAIAAPHDQADLGRGGVAERHRRAAVGAHRP